MKVATQDWHPANHISFAPNHPAPNNTPFDSFVDVNNIVGNKPEQTMKQRLWPVHCVQGTKGADIIPELDTSNIQLFVRKGQEPLVEMYSAFADSFGNPTFGSGGVSHDLAKELAANKISHVYVVGLAGEISTVITNANPYYISCWFWQTDTAVPKTDESAGDYCVKDTALGAANAGFTTYLVEEAQRCADTSKWSDAKAVLKQGSVAVVSVESDEVRRVLDS